MNKYIYINFIRQLFTRCMVAIFATLVLFILNPMEVKASKTETRPFPDEYQDEAEEANLPMLEVTDLNNHLAENPLVTIVDSSTMQFTCKLPGRVPTDDGKMYLYALQVYEYEIPSGAEPIAEVNAYYKPVIQFDLNHHQPNTRLYSKFVLCVKVDGKLVELCKPQFVSNPEALATHTHARHSYSFVGTQQECFTNLMVNSAHSTSPASLRRVVQIMNDGSDQSMTNPYARRGVADPHPISKNFYMLNANDADGVSKLISCVEYYAANAYATDDWIVGNEVNVRVWNYMALPSWEEYLRQYEQEFRICYIAIMSNNANAHVALSLDQTWDMNRGPGDSIYYMIYDTKDFLEEFSADIKENGDCNWGFAFHPYTVPLTYVKFWDMSGIAYGSLYASYIQQNKYVSFQNLGVITAFLEREDMRNPNGEVRHFTLPEMAISNGQGEDVQAAALCACFMGAKLNKYAEYILFINVNHGDFDATLTPRAADMFRNMNGADAQRVRSWALNYIGISDWSQVLR